MTIPAPPEREACDCGFEWARIQPEEIVPRIDTAVTAMRHVLRANSPDARRRPRPERWSILEYASHTRDVLLNVRDRLIVACVEDQPTPPPLYREQRVDMGLYERDTVDDVDLELRVAGDLFCKMFQAFTPAQRSRELFYGYPTTQMRTVMWGSSQALHECEHHLSDVEENQSAPS